MSNYSEGQRKRWARVSPKERSRIMSAIRKKGYEKMGKRARRKQAMRLVAARRAKKK